MQKQKTSELQQDILDYLIPEQYPITSADLKESLGYKGKNLKRALSSLVTQGLLKQSNGYGEILYSSIEYEGDGESPIPSIGRLAEFIKEDIRALLKLQAGFKDAMELAFLGGAAGIYKYDGKLLMRLNTDRAYARVINSWIRSRPDERVSLFQSAPEYYIRFYRKYHKAVKLLQGKRDVERVEISREFEVGKFPIASGVYSPAIYKPGDVWFLLHYLESEAAGAPVVTEAEFTESVREGLRVNS